MALGWLYEGDATVLRYTFSNIDTLQVWGIRGEGIVEMSLPGSIDPWVWDSASRKEEFVFTYKAIPTTYIPGHAGTGTFMDQLADLMDLFRNQGTYLSGDLPDSERHWVFKIGFHPGAKVSATHSVADNSGFLADNSVYEIPCIIKDIAIMDVSPIQQHAQIKVSLYRVGIAIGSGQV